MFVSLKNKICSFCSNNKISITTVLTIFIVVILYYCSASYKILKENTDFFSSLGSIATGISLIFVAVQVYYIKLENETRNKQLAQENAFEMAKFYGNEILPLLTASSEYLEFTGTLKLMNKIKNFDIKDFDVNELQMIFTLEEITMIADSLNKKIDLSNSVECLALGYQRSKIKYYLPFHELCNHTNNIIPAQILNDICSSDIRIDVLRMINESLNKLEYFCMYFNNNLAGSDYVYNSLHQTFLMNVKNLYFFIVYRNIDPAQKYYTEIAKLYNTWYSKETAFRQKNNC
ncbi:hypothetical protein [Phascolarctobacterium faecium]|uniref:hypothetical protein n=1 Tax=Phascolarctobacterium faecium TaxID=33025 RepID=UPI003AB8EC21